MSDRTKTELFGAMLRDRRERANRTLGALARHLGVSTPFLSDVELGRRLPLSPDRVVRAAEFIGVDAEMLLAAAVASRTAIEIATPKRESGQRALSALQRRVDDLTDEQWERIAAVVSPEGSKK